MKKLLLLVAMAGCMAGLNSCTPTREWTREERAEMRESLRDYRRMIYLDDLTDAEFAGFADHVALSLEHAYPIYARFVALPGKSDSVEYVVITTIVDDLKADARNMRHLYPYNTLTAEGVLPAGLDREQLRAFYKCLAQKVNDNYRSMQTFVQAVAAGSVDRSQMRRLQSQCANDLFDWTVTELDIFEVTE